MQLVDKPVLRKPKSDIAIASIKIKDKGEKLTIIYELPPESTETKRITFKCEERPNDAFFKALELIGLEAIALCELNWEWEDSAVTDLSFKTTDEEDEVSFSLSQVIEDRAIIVSVKHFVPSYSFKEKLDNFLAEIEDYISGKRAQQSLFDSVQNIPELGF